MPIETGGSETECVLAVPARFQSQDKSSQVYLERRESSLGTRHTSVSNHNLIRTESEHLRFGLVARAPRGVNILMIHVRFVFEARRTTIDVSNLNFEFAIVPKRFNLTMTDIITSVQIGIPFYLFM